MNNKFNYVSNYEDLTSTLSQQSLKEIDYILTAYENSQIDITDDDGDYLRSQELIIKDKNYEEVGPELLTLRWYLEYESSDYLIDFYQEIEDDEINRKLLKMRDTFKIGQIVTLSLKEIYESRYLDLAIGYNYCKKCSYKTTFFNNYVEYSIDDNHEYYDLWNNKNYLCGCDGESFKIIEINLDSFTLESLDEGIQFTLSLLELGIGYFE